MKCKCGFEERDAEHEEIPIYYKGGKKKGQLRTTEIKYTPSIKMNEIDIIGTYNVHGGYGYGEYDSCNCKSKNLTLKVCPDCKLVYFDYYY